MGSHLIGLIIVDIQWNFTSQETKECIHVRETLITISINERVIPCVAMYA